MKKIKVVTIVGTRPELIRLSRVINELNKSNTVDHKLIHTGQNYDYELNQIFFEDLNINPPDFYLNVQGNSPAEKIGEIIKLVDKKLRLISPDAILVLGDTNSCLSALSAKRLKIPIFHMEAGNRCFDLRVPEEINRKIVDHISDINLTYSEIAREYLLREGISPDTIIKTGSPMFEVLNFYKKEIDTSNILNQLKLEKKKYFVVSFHREENIENKKNISNVVNLLNKLVELYDFRIIFSTHPRTRNKINLLNFKINDKIELLKPLGFFQYNKLQKESFMVLSDSGTISEESNILNFRAINLRENHERPEAMVQTPLVMSGLEPDNILRCIKLVEKQKVNEREFKLVSDYSNDNVSKKVLRIILSYIPYVNRLTWKKY